MALVEGVGAWILRVIEMQPFWRKISQKYLELKGPDKTLIGVVMRMDWGSFWLGWVSQCCYSQTDSLKQLFPLAGVCNCC
jgi:hypothetical protein